MFLNAATNVVRPSVKANNKNWYSRKINNRFWLKFTVPTIVKTMGICVYWNIRLQLPATTVLKSNNIINWRNKCLLAIQIPVHRFRRVNIYVRSDTLAYKTYNTKSISASSSATASSGRPRILLANIKIHKKHNKTLLLLFCSLSYFGI